MTTYSIITGDGLEHGSGLAWDAAMGGAQQTADERMCEMFVAAAGDGERAGREWSVMPSVESMRVRGYRCVREVVSGQGYLGGDGVACYRVRRPDGSVVSPLTTCRSAVRAWASAIRAEVRS